MTISTICVHGPTCPDGRASAIILHDAFPAAKVVFLTHDTQEYLELPAEPDQVWCDIVPPHARASEFVAAGAWVLDHHKGAKDIVAMFGERGVFADEKERPGVSGAMLAWEFVMRMLGAENYRILKCTRKPRYSAHGISTKLVAQSGSQLSLVFATRGRDRVQIGKMLTSRRQRSSFTHPSGGLTLTNRLVRQPASDTKHSRAPALLSAPSFRRSALPRFSAPSTSRLRQTKIRHASAILEGTTFVSDAAELVVSTSATW